VIPDRPRLAVADGRDQRTLPSAGGGGDRGPDLDHRVPDLPGDRGYLLLGRVPVLRAHPRGRLVERGGHRYRRWVRPDVDHRLPLDRPAESFPGGPAEQPV